MSSGAQVDLDWAGMDAAQSGAQNSGANTPGEARSANGLTGAGTPAASAAHLTDEEILGMDTASQEGGFGRLGRPEGPASAGESGGAGEKIPGSEDPGYSNTNSGAGTMPAWMQAAANDPKHAGEAQQLWQEHQAFRAAFSSAEEARAMKELLPGGAQEVQALRQIAQEVDSLRQGAESLREAAQSVDRIDAAIFSGDARAQSEVVAEMARANPAAFRSMFAEAAKVLAGMEARGRGQEAGNFDQAAANNFTARPTLRETREGWGTHTQNQGLNQNQNRNQGLNQNQNQNQNLNQNSNQNQNLDQKQTGTQGMTGGSMASAVAGRQSPVTGQQSSTFDPAAYASFERSTNEVVARDVRGSISETLGRVLPEGVADGAARRIGEDIFNEVHRALAADRSLSEQVGEVLRERRFGSGEQRRVASLLAGRAKQIVPSVARRVIGEWTSSVLGTARTKAARQAAAAARVDIAAPGGSLDSMPLRAMSSREVNYASMSDDEILGM